jgi:hypothetical protein
MCCLPNKITQVYQLIQHKNQSIMLTVNLIEGVIIGNNIE